MSTTLGIDLASQPKATGFCAVEWLADGAVVRELCRGKTTGGVELDDAFLADAMRGEVSDRPSKVAIDAPLGWPVEFVRALNDATRWPFGTDQPGRRRLVRRVTDHWIHEKANKLPLSVSADRIAYPAMRAAGLLAHYARTTGQVVDRSGEIGLVCEAYPDPTIRAFGLWPDEASGKQSSYKGNAHGVRTAIVARLRDRAPWLEMSAEQIAACVENDDCLDALMCALVARAAESEGLVWPVPVEDVEHARAEGWIRLPTGDALDNLVAGARPSVP